MDVLFYMLVVLQSCSIVHGGLTRQYFITEPKNVTVQSGTHLIMPCTVDNKQGLCQWTKDGFGGDLLGWPRYSMTNNSLECDLHINPVLPEDEGLYQCQVGGVQGVAAIASQPARVSVLSEPGPPHIEQANVNDVMVVKEGEEVILDCQSQGGRPAAEILWTSKDIKVSNIIKKVELMKDGKSFKTSSTLRFTPKKSVSVTCSAFNEEFKHPKTSRPIQIEVKNKPDIEMIFDKTSVKEGENLEIKCLVTNIDEDLKYSWFVNNLEIEGINGSVFKLDPVTRNQNNAEIKCAVKNWVGVTEITKMLDVRFSPTIVLHPHSKNVQAGEMLELTCTAEGNPEPKYVWFKGKSGKLVGQDQHLELVVLDETEGEYTCEVYSEGFESISSMPATVAIKRKPRISVELVKYGNIDKDIILQCKVDTFSKQTKILWTKKHEPINLKSEKYQEFHGIEDQNQIKSDLAIFKLTNDDFGEYGCFANNEIGTDYKTISLKKERTVNSIATIMYVNIIIGFLILLCLFIYYQHKKCLRPKENILPFYKSTIMPIYKNDDVSIFDKLLLENKKEAKKNVCGVKLDLDSSYG